MTKPGRWQKSAPLLCLEWVWFLLSVLPHILYAFYTRLLPTKGNSLDGKVVLVTGAAEGLGRELALVFAKEGCKLACVDRDQQEVLETAAEVARDGEMARAYSVDLAKAQDVRVLRETVTKDLGAVDVLVICSSREVVARLEDTAEAAVQEVLNLNLLAPIWLIREFLPGMKERASGHVVVVSSAAAHCPLANAAPYAASQWAVAGLMESLRQEVLDEGYKGIHFTSVFPAFLKSSRYKTMFNFWQRLTSQHEEVVAVNTLSTVKRNATSVNLPEYLYWLHSFNKLLPTPISDWFFGLLYFGKMAVPQEPGDRAESRNSPT